MLRKDDLKGEPLMSRITSSSRNFQWNSLDACPVGTIDDPFSRDRRPAKLGADTGLPLFGTRSLISAVVLQEATWSARRCRDGLQDLQHYACLGRCLALYPLTSVLNSVCTNSVTVPEASSLPQARRLGNKLPVNVWGIRGNWRGPHHFAMTRR